MKNIFALIKKSDYIQSLCINERCSLEDSCLKSDWFHNLPLKSMKSHYLDSDNWNLPETEISKIQAYTEDLCDYAHEIICLCRNIKKSPVKHCLKVITDFLPPWIVFPMYHSRALGWRMGTGEDYLLAYHQFVASLTPEELALYKITYPRPCYLEVWGHY